MNYVYLPVDNVNSYSCYVIQNEGTIRAYITTPRNNSSSNYVDFYINSHYLSNTGTQTWGNTSNLPTCLNKSIITNDFYYRNDLSDIMIIFLIMTIFCIYLPIKIFSRLFKRGGL